MVEGIGNLLEGREWRVGLIKTHACVKFSKARKKECPRERMPPRMAKE